MPYRTVRNNSDRPYYLDRAVLDEAVKRFPWKLRHAREHGLNSADLFSWVDLIRAEYWMILKDEEKKGRKL